MEASDLLIIKQALRLSMADEMAEIAAKPDVSLPNKAAFLEEIHRRCSEKEKSERKHTPIRFIIAAAITVALIASITAAAIVANKEKNGRFREERKSAYTALSVIEEDDGALFIEEVIIPNYLPMGYEKASSELGRRYAQTVWNNNGNEIKLRQIPIRGSKVLIDLTAKKEIFADKTVYYVEKSEYSLVTFYDEDYIFTITACPKLDRAELEKIIESIFDLKHIASN